MTIYLAVYSHINKEAITTITLNLVLADKYRFQVTGKDIQAVSVVIGLVAAGAVIPNCRGDIISSQYEAAFRKAWKIHEQRKGRSEANIKDAEDKINYTMVDRQAWAPGMFSWGKGEEFKTLNGTRKRSPPS